jgi:high-affinity nickel-transport protein
MALRRSLPQLHLALTTRSTLMPPIDKTGSSLKTRLLVLGGIVTLLNIGAWLWAVTAFYDRPVLLSVALMVYGLGLRHAVDADHIAAIDNVTRKLMQEDKRPVAVGFFFAIGHSAIVTLVAAIVAMATNMLDGFEKLRNISGTISTCASAFFLFAIAAMNIAIFISTYRTYRRTQTGRVYHENELNALLNGPGLLSRLFRPVFHLVTKSWHIFLLGFLFGLGFDTATEIAMFGVTATQSAQGVSFAAMLIFPTIFAAGMSLIDSADGVMMLGVYEWAFVKPVRKLCYNMTITIVSALVALVVGGIEALRLIGDKLLLSGLLWDAAAAINNDFNTLGYVIIGIFFISWALSYAMYRFGILDAPVGFVLPGPVKRTYIQANT